MQDQLIAVNPCDAVKAPKAEDKEMKTITPEQTARLLRGLEGTRYHVPVLLAVTCGLRRGELLALRWSEIDLTGGKLAVNQALEQTKEGIRSKRPKTKKSARSVALPALAVAALKTHKSEQNAAKLEQGNTWKDNNLVFPTHDGGYWSPSHFSRMFTFHARKLGIDCRLHDLRHSHATQMLAAGVHPKVISERLGHSKVGFTMDTYAHVIEGMDADAAKCIGAALNAAIAKDTKKAR